MGNFLSFPSKRIESAEANDPSLLKKHSTFEDYTTPSGRTYCHIRTFYKAHQQAAQLPKDLPLLVFTHGLGGSASQFAPLLTSLINLAPCLVIDMPGCGLSGYAPDDDEACSTHALAELLYTAIGKYRDKENNQKLVLVGHSMGCSINALLGSSTSPLSKLLDGDIIGMICICPRGSPMTEREINMIWIFSLLPEPIFEALRWYDRRGGLNSESVTRFVGSNADNDVRKLQLRYNEQSETPVLKRMVTNSVGAKGLPNADIWSGIKVPLFVIAAAADKVTPASEAELITTWLKTSEGTSEQQVEGVSSASSIPSSAGDVEGAVSGPAAPIQPGKVETESLRTNGVQTDGSGAAIKDDHTSSRHSFALKTTIFPQPAAHGLLYSSSTVPVLSGMIENFLANHVDEQLGAAWQLHHLTTSGKWDVKNLTKWQAVDPCSAPIGGVFRAMKTMREVDETHCPKEFVKHFSSAVLSDGVAVVLDISHESPVYRPQGLEAAGVDYYKLPTVSKEKPRPEEVEHFSKIIDDLRALPKLQPSGESHPTIGVHCHYGFNRTGFMIICYLVERMDYTLKDAIEEFTQKRAPGIKHQYFVNELYVRYGISMERRATVVSL